MAAMPNVLKKSLNKNEIKMKTFQFSNPADPANTPCKMRQITQYFSVGNGPYVPVLIGVCFGSCFAVTAPSNNTFINSICTSCQETALVNKAIVFFKGAPNERVMEIQSAKGCKCKMCKH